MVSYFSHIPKPIPLDVSRFLKVPILYLELLMLTYGFLGTTQACAFRDGHDTLTSTGLTIFGLSSDSPKSNTTFKTKQSLPYTLLCNPSYSLIGAIGLQQGAAHKTKRGVWAVDKSGKVLLSFAGGPIPTVDAVKKLVDSLKK